MAKSVTTEAPRAPAVRDDELLPVLSSSLYPGARPESIRLVLEYCRAAQLDPLQKPVHIVPMSVKDAATGKYSMRDVIMPGIGLYRVQAARTGQLAGIDPPEFGPEITRRLGDRDVSFPEWCRVSVYRIVGGARCEFSAVEYWLENYATAGRDTAVPNAMWTRRPRGQIAKCAEAQALRRAFPEIGSQPTADETMLEVDVDLVQGAGSPVDVPDLIVRKRVEAPSASLDAVIEGAAVRTAAPAEKVAPAAAPAAEGEALVGAGEVAYLRNKAQSIGADLEALLVELGGLDLERLSKADFAAVRAALMRRP
jgi:phage recombination protein Bet